MGTFFWDAVVDDGEGEARNERAHDDTMVFSTVARASGTLGSLGRLFNPMTLAAVSASPATSAATKAKHTLPDLPYDYGALEPVISGEIMELHHSKHHQAYVNGLNAASEQMEDAQAKGDVASMTKLVKAINFNGGGHINHSIFWQNLCPKKDFRLPEGKLLAKIEADFGSLDNLQSSLTAITVGLQGSGWGWLGYDKSTDQLYVKTMANQNPLACGVPLFGIDAWEHAYYLQYKNVRPDYVKAIWEIVNWKDVEERFEKATS